MVLGPNDVLIDRTTKYGNPFPMKTEANRADVIQRFINHLATGGASYNLDDIKQDLKDKRLFCWCHPKPCHGDILAQLADS